MHTETPTLIASHRLLWQHADGTESIMTVNVGTPYYADNGAWACPVSLDGFDGRYRDIYGDSSLQALCLALSLVEKQLGHMLATNNTLLYLGDRSRIDSGALAALFGRGKPPT